MLRFYDKEKRDITDELDSPSLFCGNPACLGEPWCSAWGICKDVAVEPKNSAAAMEEEEVSGVEQEYTSLFLELSQQLQSSSTPELSPAQASSLASSTLPQPSTSSIVSSIHFPVKNEPSSSSTKSRQFAQIKTDEEIELARTSGIPSKTKQDTKYCIGLWEAWTSYRNKENEDEIKSIGMLSREELQYWLTRFILEVKMIL